jgi:thioredoxin-like negative regulator of GroEL
MASLNHAQDIHRNVSAMGIHSWGANMIETTLDGALSAIADTSTPVVLDIHAEWCGYCIRTRPHLEQISADRVGTLRIIGIDADEYPDVFTKFKVKTLPAIILFKDGEEIARRGSGNLEELTAWLAEHGA